LRRCSADGTYDPPVTEPAAPAPTTRPRWLKALVAGVVAFELVAAAALVATDHTRQVRHSAAPHDQSQQPTAPASPRQRSDAADRAAQRRAQAVAALLAQRAHAIRARDRAAFQATLDPTQQQFVTKQLAMFGALEEVPLASWTYELSDEGAVAPESPEIGRYLARYAATGADAWAPIATLRYQLRGFDTTPTAVRQFFTFVERDGRWLTASDTDFPGDRKTARDVWDFGPVTVVRGTRSLVLGHPGHTTMLRDVARQADAAVPRVSAVWGKDWSQRAVVVVPETQKELAAILGDGTDLSRIAAVAVAELPADAGSHPVGNRVIVNPPNFRRLGANGRRVVLTHEVTHVATRDATGAGVPTWLVEGFADYVGYLGTGLGPKAICQELAAEVRKGRKPTTLPADADFAGTNARLAQAYEASWLAVRLIAERAGRAGLVAFYRAVGDDLDAALRTTLHTTPETFTAAWRSYVTRELT
jgi:hypothetical protein